MASVLVVYRSRMNRAYATDRSSEREIAMTRLEREVHTATVHTTRFGRRVALAQPSCDRRRRFQYPHEFAAAVNTFLAA